jgi:DNA-directed RNA polymerase subunit RPC12/RpoP
MRSMGGINRLPVETYVCVACEKEYADAEVRHTWRCPECDAYIYVHAVGVDSPDDHIAIVRKRASEVERGDLVLLPGQLDGEAYVVLGISEAQGKLGIGLKNYGQYKVSPDEPMNCRVGAW